MENRKADPNIRNNDGDTILYDAVCNTSSSDDSCDIVELMWKRSQKKDLQLVRFMKPVAFQKRYPSIWLGFCWRMVQM